MKTQNYFKSKHLLIFIVSLLLLFPFQELFAQDWVTYVKDQTKGKENNFYAVQKAFNDYWKDKTPSKGIGYKQFRRWEWYWEQRVNANGSFPPNDIVVKEWSKYLDQQVDSPQTPGSTGNWTPKGPNSSEGGYAGIGRINCIAFHPTNFNTFWVGTPAGGLWKTTNFGSTWTTVTDNMPVLGVSDIAINPTNPNIMYIATGDGDGGSLSGCTGSPEGDTKSIGVLKSIDGGQTWNQTGMNWSVTEAKLIRRLIINPSDPNTLYAAASDGIWKTTNSGTTWTNIFLSNPVTYFMDIEFKPGDPNTIYASTYTLYGNAEIKISYDGGTTWYTTSLVDDIIRIDLAVSASFPNLIEGICANTNGAFAGWVESSDSFNNYSWYAAELGTGNLLSGSYPLTTNTTTGQGSYDLAYAINPTNSNERYLGGIVTYKTTDGWNSNLNLANFWAGAPNGNPGVPIVHADKHFLTFHPLNPAYLFECNDGGLYWTNNGGTTWNDISNGLQISQIYRIGNSVSDAQDIICGLQDNGSKEYYSGTWYDVTGGDGMECAIDPANGYIMYASYVNGTLYRTMDGWGSKITISNNLPGGQQPGAWVTPYILDPNNPQTIYAGYNDVYKSTNRGDSWTQISSGITQGYSLRSLAVAPSNSQYIYAAKFSAIYKTINGGGSWIDITTGLPPYPARISYIAVSPTDPNTVFVSMSGYVFGNKVFKSTNGGSSWSNISGSLPDLPVNCIVYQTGSNEGLYIGTDVGVYYKNAAMSDWIYFSTGLPNVVVTELEIHYGSGKLRAATFGRGLWESDLWVATSFQITTVSNPTNGGTTSGGGTFNQGAQCTVNATANPSWNFINWTENGNVVSTSASYSFAVTGNSTLTANFTQQQTYNITTASNPVAGGSTAGGGAFTSGQQCTVTATANTGYNFTNWTENGNVVSTSAAYSFAVTANRSLVANFTQQQFTVTTSANPSIGGTTSGGGTFNYGTTVTVIASANANWLFTNWTENGNIVSTNASYSFALTANRVLVANFAEQGVQYTITANANPNIGGYTTGAGSYNSGSQATVNAIANIGWVFLNWTEYGSQVSTNPSYSFTVNGNRDLTANFQQQFTIIASVTPANAGYTSGGGTYTSGQVATVQAYANPGFAFYRWNENGSPVSSTASYSFTVNSNRTLVASFLSTVGINEQDTPGISVFPNPANDLLTLEVKQGYDYSIETIEIINPAGQTVIKIKQNLLTEQTQIDISQLTDGIYILKLKMQNGSYKTFRVIVKK
jgi:hypothetical protein